MHMPHISSIEFYQIMNDFYTEQIYSPDIFR